MGSRVTHEMMLDEDPSKRKKCMAFKASTDSEDELDDEEPALIIRKSSALLRRIQM